MRPPAPAPNRRPRGRILLVGAALVGSATLSACQLPDVSMSPSAAERSTTSTATTSTATTSTTTPSTAPATTGPAPTAVSALAPVRPSGELDTGSTTHVVAAGDRQVVVDWWTAEQATAWTAGAEKTVQLSAHLEGGDSDLEVLITRFSAVLDDGTARTPLADDRGEFAFQAPYPYGTALTLPASSAGTTSVSVDVQFDLLVETEPGSQRYFRQTVLDSLVLPLATPTQENP